MSDTRSLDELAKSVGPDVSKLPPEFVVQLQHVCGNIARRLRYRFVALHHISADDLRQKALTHALTIHPMYSPEKGQYRAFIYERVFNKLIDWSRTELARKRREKEVARVETDLPGSGPPAPRVVDRPIEDFTIKNLIVKVTVARCMDAELARLLEQRAECDNVDFCMGIDSAVFAIQKLRKDLIGEYLPLVVGTRRFTADSMVMFAPKEV